MAGEPPTTRDSDQRHDGSFDRPTPASIQINTEITAVVAARNDLSAVRSRSSQNVVGSPTLLPKVRKSVQLPRPDTDPASLHRRSTQIGRDRTAPRRSEDFDVRRDGPYGRCSINMVRRRSSVGTVGAHSTDAIRAHSQAQDPSTQNVEALEGYQTAEELRPFYEPEPPPLNYSLWERRWFIAFFWGMILIDCIAAPIVLYFCLWYLTDLSPNATFSIVTAALGGVSIVEYFVRFWRLWKKSSTCRVLGAKRKYLDWFHWNFTVGWVFIMIELIVGTVPENPPIRLLAMPLASMMWVFGTELLVVDIMRYFKIPAPVRISSIPKGAQLRPAIYSMIEDVVAVDGSGGTEYREALNRRYEASHVFRSLLRRLGVFWAIGAEGTAMVTTILVFTIGPDAAYVVGWTVPFIWAGIWTGLTIIYAKHMLKKEQQAWTEELQEKQGAMAMAGLSERSSEVKPDDDSGPITEHASGLQPIAQPPNLNDSKVGAPTDTTPSRSRTADAPTATAASPDQSAKA